MTDMAPYFQRKTAVLAQRRADFGENPDAAMVRLKASSHVAGVTGTRPTRMGEYIVISDSAPGLAGHSLGPSSPEMVLGALASCLVHTYLLQATLLEIPLDHVEVEVTGALNMTGVVGLPIHGKIEMEGIGYTPHVSSSASPEEIERLHAAVEEGCAVLNTLREPVTVTCHR